MQVKIHVVKSLQEMKCRTCPNKCLTSGYVFTFINESDVLYGATCTVQAFYVKIRK